MLSSTWSRSLRGLALSSPKPSTFAAAVGAQTRTFASVLPDAPATSKVAFGGSKIPEGHARPHLGVEVDPNHGLYGFFRRIEKDGQVEYETLQTREHVNLGSSALPSVSLVFVTTEIAT